MTAQDQTERAPDNGKSEDVDERKKPEKGKTDSGQTPEQGRTRNEFLQPGPDVGKEDLEKPDADHDGHTDIPGHLGSSSGNIGLCERHPHDRRLGNHAGTPGEDRNEYRRARPIVEEYPDRGAWMSHWDCRSACRATLSSRRSPKRTPVSFRETSCQTRSRRGNCTQEEWPREKPTWLHCPPGTNPLIFRYKPTNAASPHEHTQIGMGTGLTARSIVAQASRPCKHF